MTVYCIKRIADRSNLYKFGFSGNIEQRLASYRNQHPEGVELIASVPGGRDLEAFILCLLKEDRVAGEWFRPGDRVATVIDVLQNLARKRGGNVGDLQTRCPEVPDYPAVPDEGELLTPIWDAAPDFSQIPENEARHIQSLSWEERHRMAVSVREWAANAAEWIMPELAAGRP